MSSFEKASLKEIILCGCLTFLNSFCIFKNSFKIPSDSFPRYREFCATNSRIVSVASIVNSVNARCRVFLLSLLVYNRYEILIVEKKRLEIDKELYQLQVKFERRQKEYNEKENQQRAEIKHMIKEIKTHK